MVDDDDDVNCGPVWDGSASKRDLWCGYRLFNRRRLAPTAWLSHLEECNDPLSGCVYFLDECGCHVLNANVCLFFVF